MVSIKYNACFFFNREEIGRTEQAKTHHKTDLHDQTRTTKHHSDHSKSRLDTSASDTTHGQAKEAQKWRMWEAEALCLLGLGSSPTRPRHVVQLALNVCLGNQHDCGDAMCVSLLVDKLRRRITQARCSQCHRKQRRTARKSAVVTSLP